MFAIIPRAPRSSRHLPNSATCVILVGSAAAAAAERNYRRVGSEIAVGGLCLGNVCLATTGIARAGEKADARACPFALADARNYLSRLDMQHN